MSLDNIFSLIKEEFVSEYGEFTYIKYYPSEHGKIVFNVSGLVLNAISHYFENVKVDSELLEMGVKLMQTLSHFQIEDGSWPYSFYYEKDRFKTQLDYHQGFIIDGMTRFSSFMDDELKDKFSPVINKAIKFYREKQFDREGWSYYRYPQKYPIDIHNQAQGIITFVNLYKVFKEKEYLDFAMRIAKWTLENMQDKEGFFYHQRWPILINKIPYIRWNQVWMMVALVNMLSVIGGGGNN